MFGKLYPDLSKLENWRNLLLLDRSLDNVLIYFDSEASYQYVIHTIAVIKLCLRLMQ